MLVFLVLIVIIGILGFAAIPILAGAAAERLWRWLNPNN